jgi:Hemerythrin HHE cation binding domain
MDAPHFSKHYRRLEGLLAELRALVLADDPRGLRPFWTAFERELRDHLAAEETCLLPAFGETHANKARSLRQDHAQIKDLLEEIGMRIDLHLVRAKAVDHLIDVLREHTRREDAWMDAWTRRYRLDSAVFRLRKALRHDAAGRVA